MNYTTVKKGLELHRAAEVDRFINYLKQLETEKNKEGEITNKWFKFFTEQQAIDVYSKVAIDNLSIDGETVTLQFRGSILVSYNYQAYKNRVLNAYPETTFDMQLVHTGDDYSFHKDSGRVIYSHKIGNPFDTSREIIGAYCIIKNSRGEFLETINMAEVEKMKQAARTQKVWNEWLSEMVIKSVIKRACKRHFKDITHNIDSIDNENFDLDTVGFDSMLKTKIENATTFMELNKIYKSELSKVTDEVAFINLLSDRKKELMELLPEITAADYPEAVKKLQSGKKPTDLAFIWKITDEQMQDILAMAI